MKHATLELLAPAGSMEAFHAAISAGADAVYLGSAFFGARASAGFDESTLRQAIRLAHQCDRRVYVTVNTLIKQGELPYVEKTLQMLLDMHVDAVLVQDLGVMRLCLERFPGLPLHASTQMALNTPSGAALLKHFGVERMVLARECTLSDISAISATGIETEVFVHGAMCAGVSGQCLLSVMGGGRSGNRGRCAQPCRMQYTYRDKQAAWLSPADLCTRDILDALIKAGVSSLKIEGRLKRPEYVYTVTSAYKKAIDGALNGTFSPAEQVESDALVQIFSRGAFTKGYVGGAQDAKIIYQHRVTPLGLPIGKVVALKNAGSVPLCEVLVVRALNNGDGLIVGEQAMIYSGRDVPAGETAVLRLRIPAHVGETVRRTEDEAQLCAARAGYMGNALYEQLSIPFDAVLTTFPGECATLTLNSRDISVTVKGQIVDAASNRPMDALYARRFLEKTGGTPYALRTLDYVGENAYLSASALNTLRKAGLDALCEASIKAHESALPRRAPVAFTTPIFFYTAPRIFARTSDIDIANALMNAGAQVYFAPRKIDRGFLTQAFSALAQGVGLALPPVCHEEDLALLSALAHERRLPVMVGSVGQLGLDWHVPIITGPDVPVMNTLAESVLHTLGVRAVTLSEEMSGEEIKALPNIKSERLLYAYGRARLMTLTHCPERVYRGLSKARETCNLCGAGSGAQGQCLIDRRRNAFPLFPIRLQRGCKVDVLNHLPTSLLKKLPTMNSTFSLLLDFTLEKKEEALAVYHAFKNDGELPFPTTLGRFESGAL